MSCLHERGSGNETELVKTQLRYLSSVKEAPGWFKNYVSFYLKLLGRLFVEREFEWKEGVGPMPGVFLSQYVTTL